MYVLAAETADEQQLPGADVLEQELGAQRPVVAVFRIGRTARDIVKQRIVLIRLKRDTAVGTVPDLAIDRALDVHEVVRAHGYVDVAAVLVGRAPRDEAREAAGRIAVEQRALRAAQHLDAVDVKQRERKAGHLADVYVVDVDRRRALLMVGKVVLRDSADRQAE